MKPNPFSALKNFTVPCATATQISNREIDHFDLVVILNTSRHRGGYFKKIVVTPISHEKSALRAANAAMTPLSIAILGNRDYLGPRVSSEQNSRLLVKGAPLQGAKLEAR